MPSPSPTSPVIPNILVKLPTVSLIIDHASLNIGTIASLTQVPKILNAGIIVDCIKSPNALNAGINKFVTTGITAESICAKILNAGTIICVTNDASVSNDFISMFNIAGFAKACWKLLLNSASLCLALVKFSARLDLFVALPCSPIALLYPSISIAARLAAPT